VQCSAAEERGVEKRSEVKKSMTSGKIRKESFYTKE
jgi:hypothetical protein